MSVGDYCRAEIEVVAEEEWIVTMDDFLRRRTRLASSNVRPTCTPIRASSRPAASCCPNTLRQRGAAGR